MLGPFLFLGVPMICYLLQAAEYSWHAKPRRIGMTIAMVGYAIGNVGLIIDRIEQSQGE